MNLILLCAIIGYTPNQLADARAAVAVTLLNIEIAQGPELPDTPPQASPPAAEPAAESPELEKLRSQVEQLREENAKLRQTIDDLLKPPPPVETPTPLTPVPEEIQPKPVKAHVASQVRLIVAAGADPVRQSEVDIDYYSASWCQFCPEQTKRVDAAAKSGGTGLKFRKHYDEPTPPIVEKNANREAKLPLFVWKNGAGELLCHEGLISIDELRRKVMFDIEPQSVPGGFGAEPPGVATIDGADVILPAIAHVKSFLGPDAEAAITWVRNGDKDLKVGDKWTRPKLIGTAGRVEIEIRNSATKLFITKIGAAYDWPEGRAKPKITIDPVELDLPDGAFGAGEPAGSPLAMILTAWSLISFLNDAIHPTVSLNLGTTVVCTAKFVDDSLHISFVQPGEKPAKRGEIRGVGVTLHWLIDWPRRLTGVEISKTAVVAEFDENRWWRRVSLPYQ